MSKFNVGDKVIYMGKDHREMPEFYPEIGTIGTVAEDGGDTDWRIQWPKGSTSGKDCWYCDENDIELVENVDMTNEEMKGRPFKIGEKKKKGGHWEWIKPNEIVPDGTKVRYMKRAEGDGGNYPYFPNIGQECIKLNAPDFYDTDFWVQFEGSEYEYICRNSCHDCFQKWVEDDE